MAKPAATDEVTAEDKAAKTGQSATDDGPKDGVESPAATVAEKPTDEPSDTSASKSYEAGTEDQKTENTTPSHNLRPKETKKETLRQEEQQPTDTKPIAAVEEQPTEAPTS